MKKFIYLAASLSIVFGCAEKINEPECMPVPGDAFVLTVEAPSTKTVFDGKDYSVEWESEDILGVYITAEGSETPEYYTFEKGEGNQFWSKDFKPEADKSYTYTVVYPCPEVTEPADGKVNISIVSGTQSGADNSSHIQTPLYGSSSVPAGESPKIVLKHLASIIRVTVKNSMSESLSVEKVSVKTAGDAPAAVAGTFALDLTTGVISAAEGASFSEASVAVTSGTVESPAVFFLLMAPYSGDADVTVTAGERNFTVAKSGLNFKDGLVYSTEVICSDIWLEGSAIPVGSNAALTKTVEDANVFAWYADLKAGNLSIVNQDGQIKPEDGTFGKTSAYSAGDYVYTISSAGKYRVVVNTETKKVTVYDPATDLKPFEVTWYKRGDSETYPNGHHVVVTDRLWYYGSGTNWKAENNEIIFTPSLADPQILVFQTTEGGKRIKGGKTKFYIEHGATFDPAGDGADETFGMSDWFLGSTRVDDNGDGKHDTEGNSVEVSLHRGLDQWTTMYGGYDQRESWFNLGFWPDNLIIDLRNMRLKADEVGKY